MVIAFVSCCHAQTFYSAQERNVPFAFGTGMSNFDLDWGTSHGNERRMDGITVWLDYTPPKLPRLLNGLDIEIEGRDINYALPSSLKRMRQDTGAGGLIYSYHRYGVIHPYAKALVGMGSIDFAPTGQYTHDTRIIYAPGAGLELRAFKSIKVRADYEYQFWPRLFGPNSLNPNGFTIGTEYDFRPRPTSTY
jgi:opacity protein-like surface antigen